MNKINSPQAEDMIVYKLVAKECHKDGEPVKVHFILENRSDKKLFFLKWYTPFEGLNSDMFRITLNGKQIQYEGRMVKRGIQSFDEYLLIDPENSLDTVVELSLVYNMNEPGEYQVEYRGKIYDFIFASEAKEAEKIFSKSPDKPKMIEISGNSLNLKIGKF
jgi:peptidyl-Lys metalloendopeptidase